METALMFIRTWLSQLIKIWSLYYKKETEDSWGMTLFTIKVQKGIIELNQYITYWKFKNIRIEAWLYGDGDRILISVDYIFMKSDKLSKIKKLL